MLFRSAKLTKGEIDFNDPHSPDTQSAMKGGSAPTPEAQSPAAPTPAQAPAPASPAAPAGAPPMQNASTFHPGLALSEQLLVLSGVLTVEQAEKNKKKKSK